MTPSNHLFQRVLGPQWNVLPEVTRTLHSPDPEVVFAGQADIVWGKNPLANLVALILGAPKPGLAVPVTVKARRMETGERLTRDYGGSPFISELQALETPDGLRLTEKIGPITTLLRLEGTPEGISFHPERAFWHGLPLPRFLTPIVDATERSDGQAHLFDVKGSLPLIGLVFAYKGRLVQVATEPAQA